MDYIDRQAAIAALREFAEECKGSTEAATAAAMAISVISRLPGPWVNVEDALPQGDNLPKNKSGIILAVRYDAGQIVIFGWRNGFGEWVGVPRGGTVTHWMPQPDAPEVGTK